MLILPFSTLKKKTHVIWCDGRTDEERTILGYYIIERENFWDSNK